MPDLTEQPTDDRSLRGAQAVAPCGRPDHLHPSQTDAVFCALRHRDKAARLEWTGTIIAAFFDRSCSGETVRAMAAEADIDYSSVQAHVQLAKASTDWKSIVQGELAPLCLRTLRGLRAAGVSTKRQLRAFRDDPNALRLVRGIGAKGVGEIDQFLATD